MPTPKPGKSVRGSATGRPIMAALDLLGRRWALRILWELRDGDTTTFRELQSRCGDLSPSVLNARIKELRDANILDHDGEGYTLTKHGTSLIDALEPLYHWSTKWAKSLKT